MIQNACATQALVNLLMNAESPDIQLGPILADFRSFTADFDAQVSSAPFILLTQVRWYSEQGPLPEQQRGDPPRPQLLRPPASL